MKKGLLIMIAIVLFCVPLGGHAMINKTNNIVTETKTTEATELINEVKEIQGPPELKIYKTGWATCRVNVRISPNTNCEILDVLEYNSEVEYTEYTSDWVEIKYKDTTGYVFKKYISNEKCNYKIYDAPYSSGFKSYMPYKAITLKTSKQYKLQQQYAYTGEYGIRQVNDRFCVAVGSYYTKEIGTYLDLILENGTVIPCILADQKADHDTDSNNKITEHNGCLSEFVVDSSSLYRLAKTYGDISKCNELWDSPVKYIKVYDENIFN